MVVVEPPLYLLLLLLAFIRTEGANTSLYPVALLSSCRQPAARGDEVGVANCFPFAIWPGTHLDACVSDPPPSPFRSVGGVGDILNGGRMRKGGEADNQGILGMR